MDVLGESIGPLRAWLRLDGVWGVEGITFQQNTIYWKEEERARNDQRDRSDPFVFTDCRNRTIQVLGKLSWAINIKVTTGA